ncbi:MAG TPA: hypothetical protein VKL19_07165 [Thermoanaerobaculia bacterium]|nr:hypothetical protein [Thermoanaerobaculia bacterium]
MLLLLLMIWTRWSAPQAARVDFQKEIRPILEQRCQPCHFPGGRMYERLPFDRPETITRLGTKLFTRIREEKQRELIRRFLVSQRSPD